MKGSAEVSHKLLFQGKRNREACGYGLFLKKSNGAMGGSGYGNAKKH